MNQYEFEAWLVMFIQQVFLGTALMILAGLTIGAIVGGITWIIEKVFRIEGLVDRVLKIPPRGK